MEKNKFSNGGKKVVDCYVRVAQIVGTACRESGGRERKWEKMERERGREREFHTS